MPLSRRSLELPVFSQIVPKKKAKSLVWEHFGLPADEGGAILTTDVAVCTLCRSPISSKGGNTSNLFSHLKLYHPAQFFELSMKSPPSQITVDDMNSSCNISQEIVHPVNETIEQNTKRQKTVHNFQSLDENSSKQITDSIAKFLVTTMQSHNLVEQQSFIDMIKVLNPHYKLADKKNFSKTVVPILYEETKEMIRQELAKSRDTDISITTDCWTSAVNISYIGVTAHFISSDWTLKTVFLSCSHFKEDHSCKDLADLLKNILSDWAIDLERISACTTHNESNVMKAIQKIQLPHIPCFGHNINIGVNQALELPQLSEPIIRLKKLQSAIAHSYKMRADLTKAQNLLKTDVKSLPTVYSTGWWSTLKLASRYLQNQFPICKMLLEYPDKKCLMLEGNETVALQDFVSATSLLEDMAKSLSGEDYVSSSYILPLCQQMKKKLQTKECDTKLIKTIKEEILNALSKYEVEPLATILNLSSLCDPRFRLHFVDLAEDVKRIALEKMANLYNNIKTDTNTKQEKVSTKKTRKSFAKFFDVEDEFIESKNCPGKQAEMELNNYLAMPKVHFDENPLQWWKLHEASFPTLKILARSYLAIQGTSVASERVFSTSKNIIDKQRAFIPTKYAEMQVFLAENKEFLK